MHTLNNNFTHMEDSILQSYYCEYQKSSRGSLSTAKVCSPSECSLGGGALGGGLTMGVAETSDDSCGGGG